MAITLNGTTGITTPDVNTDDLSVDTDTLFVDATNNRVGIGVTAPAGRLHVRDDAVTGKYVFQSTDQRLTLGTYWQSGVGHAFINSSSDNESVAQPLLFQTGSVERARIGASGNIGIGIGPSGSRVIIGRDNPATYFSAQLELISQAGDVVLGFHAGGASAECIEHLRGGLGIRVTSGDRSVFRPIAASAFNVNSDYRIKENLQPLTGAADRLIQIPVHRFSFTEGSMMYQDGALVDGFLAHEVQVVVPEAVTGEKDAVNDEGQPVYQAVDQSKLVPLLTAALQEALTKISQLETRIAALEGGA